MIGRLFAFLLFTTISLTQTVAVPHPISLTEAELGDNITLQCPVSHEGNRFFHWYKQPVGYLVQTVAKWTHGTVEVIGQFKDSRFTITKGVAEYFLTIGNVRKEDEATYFCQSATVYAQSFINGTFLTVNDYDQQKSMDVKQEPESESVQLGDPVTLQCSLLFNSKENRTECPSGHRVYWFRSGKSHPGLVYTHWSRDADCGESPSSQTSCVYSLSKNIRSSSDAGTYYCAVLTCGEILFGNGTRVETRSGLDPVDLVLWILLTCCAIIIAVLCYCVKRGRICEHCKGATSASIHLAHGKSAVDGSRVAEAEEEALNYAALNFSTRKVQKGRKRESQQESVYSDVRADHTPHWPSV